MTGSRPPGFAAPRLNPQPQPISDSSPRSKIAYRGRKFGFVLSFLSHVMLVLLSQPSKLPPPPPFAPSLFLARCWLLTLVFFFFLLARALIPLHLSGPADWGIGATASRGENKNKHTHTKKEAQLTAVVTSGEQSERGDSSRT